MVKPGEIFLSLRGEHADGADFLAEAIGNGAVAVIAEKGLECGVPVLEARLLDIGRIAEKIYLPNGKKFRLIGVTGTNGKTTVTHLIKDILCSLGKSVGVIGTNGIFLNDALVEVYTSTPTTPKLCELYNIFHSFNSMNAEFVVMEVSSHALEQGRVAGCEFDVGVFTNLSHDHLDYHQTMENYQNAKARLFAESRLSVINIDDTAGAEIYSKIKGAKLSAGLSYADISASAISMQAEGSIFNLDYLGKSVPSGIKLGGRFNIYNALSAAGACLGLGFGLAEVAEGLKAAKAVRGRMERLETGTDFNIIIDYAHSPDGLEKVLHTVKGFARGRVIVVFGCGGERDAKKRPVMGELAGRYADYTIITSDNPRCENEMKIITDIYEGIKKTDGQFSIIPSRKMAIGHAVEIAKKDDIIILAGKGAEDYQIIGREKLHFNERETAAEYIKQKGREECKDSL